MADALTPMMQQYQRLRASVPADTLLLFRLGDFYETFDEDAEITARELDIVLTQRSVGKGVRAPLAGIALAALTGTLDIPAVRPAQRATSVSAKT